MLRGVGRKYVAGRQEHTNLRLSATIRRPRQSRRTQGCRCLGTYWTLQRAVQAAGQHLAPYFAARATAYQAERRVGARIGHTLQVQ